MMMDDDAVGCYDDVAISLGMLSSVIQWWCSIPISNCILASHWLAVRTMNICRLFTHKYCWPDMKILPGSRRTILGQIEVIIKCKFDTYKGRKEIEDERRR